MDSRALYHKKLGLTLAVGMETFPSTKNYFANLFYYLVYFYYYSWVLLHFLVLFMSHTVLS